MLPWAKWINRKATNESAKGHGCRIGQNVMILKVQLEQISAVGYITIHVQILKKIYNYILD